jgi:hypothetical protein
MKITIHWQMPIQLTRNKKIIIDQKKPPEDIENRPGVYFFSRKFGQSLIPFYIGETLSIRGRLKSHLASAQIADVLRGFSSDKEIKNGARYFHYGYLKGNADKPLTKKRLSIAQRHLIRAAIEDDVPILNSNLTKVRTHTLEFTGGWRARAIYEKMATVEAT